MYHEVVYRELWRGVDLVFRGGSRQLKYEFVVQPGAAIEDIQLTYRGAANLSLDERENLQIHTEYGILLDEKPVSYQKINGHQVRVDSSFVIKGVDIYYKNMINLSRINNKLFRNVLFKYI